MPELSVIIPARNEEWLNLTIQDVLSHIEADTEIIVILNGAWPKEPLPQHERVQIVYLPESIGQRAATNLGARISTAAYVMKLDAHVSVGPGFDRILIQTAKELGDDVTQIPAQKNLHVYDRICDKCGRREYQGSPTAQCVTCGDTTWTLDMIWKPRGGTTTIAWSFTPEPKFQYDGAMGKRSNDDIQDVMTSLGACFFMSRQRFWELDGLDTSYGSWGSFGIEVACKSWLSGGRQVVNRRTHFSHFFRVGGVGFPYPISGAQQEHARKRAHEIWFNNAWPKQVRPLSWLIEKFWPINRWSDDDRARVSAVHLNDPSVISAMPSVVANGASPIWPLGAGTVGSDGQAMPLPAPSFPSVDGGNAVASENVALGANEIKVGGVTAPPIVADDVIQLRYVLPCAARQWTNEPSVHDAVAKDVSSDGSSKPIAFCEFGADPVPATSLPVDLDLGKETSDLFSGEVCNDKVSHDAASIAVSGLGPCRVSQHSRGPSIVSKGIAYYSDNHCDLEILQSCRDKLQLSAPNIPIASVTLCDFVDWTFPLPVGSSQSVFAGERSYLSMFKQILAGLEALDTEFVFLCEQDLLYHPTHFDFTPPNATQVFYQQNVWKVDAVTGRALHYLCSQTSGLCANRELLLEHYRKRVAIVEAIGFSRKMGFEPGTHRRSERVDDLSARTWMSEYPNVDIRHSNNLTPSRWRKDQFRDQRYTKGWTESDSIPGWGVTKGRFREFLREAAHGAVQQAVA